MKKHLFLLFLVSLSFFLFNDAKAQIKLHSDGQVSLGSLGTTYGLQVVSPGRTRFRLNSNANYSYTTIAFSNVSLQKHWVVSNLQGNSSGVHTFYVLGNGNVYKAGSFRMADATYQEESHEIDSASHLLGQITGIWYIPTNSDLEPGKESVRRVGVTAQEVEKVLPELVSADENGLRYVDYEALTVLLLKALKEQKARIDKLEIIIKNNGLE